MPRYLESQQKSIPRCLKGQKKSMPRCLEGQKKSVPRCRPDQISCPTSGILPAILASPSELPLLAYPNMVKNEAKVNQDLFCKCLQNVTLGSKGLDNICGKTGPVHK